MKITVYDIWISRINNQKLKKSHPERVYKSHRICDKHFVPECVINSKSRFLKHRTLPTLLLPGFNEDPIANSVLSEATSCPCEQHNC